MKSLGHQKGWLRRFVQTSASHRIFACGLHSDTGSHTRHCLDMGLFTDLLRWHGAGVLRAPTHLPRAELLAWAASLHAHDSGSAKDGICEGPLPAVTKQLYKRTGLCQRNLSVGEQFQRAVFLWANAVFLWANINSVALKDGTSVRWGKNIKKKIMVYLWKIRSDNMD